MNTETVRSKNSYQETEETTSFSWMIQVRIALFIDYYFVSKELLEPSNEIKIKKSFLTKQKLVSCCFDLKSRQDIAESRKKQMRIFDVEQLNERMKSVQNPHDNNALDTSYDDFAKAIHESATVRPERKSSKWFKREMYLLHKQLKDGYRQT